MTSSMSNKQLITNPKALEGTPQPSDIKVPLPAKLVVGAVAGVVGTCAIFPIDIVKTRLQNQKQDKQGNLRYSGPFHAFRSIVKREGFRGLYRGLGANLVGVTPEKAIKLTANDTLRELFIDHNGNGKISLFQEVLSGAGAGLFQVIATNPMEIVKIRLQVQGTDASAPKLSTAEVVQKLGIRGLYRGSAATLARDIPFSALFFPLYANLKSVIGNEESMLTSLTAGCLAGAAASGLCTPADVVKTRLQVSGGAKRYDNMLDCFIKVWQKEGFAALYKGCVPRMMVVAPLFGISLVAFEMQKQFMIAQLRKAKASSDWKPSQNEGVSKANRADSAIATESNRS